MLVHDNLNNNDERKKRCYVRLEKSVNASIITSEGLLQKIFDFVAWLDDCVVFLDKQLSLSASLHLRL